MTISSEKQNTGPCAQVLVIYLYRRFRDDSKMLRILSETTIEIEKQNISFKLMLDVSFLQNRHHAQKIKLCSSRSEVNQQ